MPLPPGPPKFAPWLALRWLRDPFTMMRQLRAQYGETFSVHLGLLPPMVIVSHPDHVREVFAASGDEMHAGKLAAGLRPFLGERSLLVLDGAEHRTMRKLLMPPFQGERMEQYGAQMVDITHDSLDGWPLGRPFAVQRPMQSITMEVILRTVFGLDEVQGREALRAQLGELLEIAAWPPLLLPAMQRDLGPWSPWGRFVRKAERADAMLHAVVEKRRAEGTAGRTDILSRMLDARDDDGSGLSDADLRDELVTLLVAGHETTATALSWALECLLQSPRVLAKLQAEVDDAAREGLEPARIAKLEYLDAVVRESLRLRPIIPMVGRVLQAPRRIAGLDLPAGVGIAPSIYLAHRRPEAFPEPEQFRPERFLERKVSPSEWFPFGGGVRRCIGMAFALYEMKMVLATVLSRARLRAAPGPAVRPVRRSITMAPSGGMPVVVEARTLRWPVAASA